MTAPGQSDADMSFESQSATNGQGIKDLSINPPLPDVSQNVEANDVAHLKNQVSEVNGVDSAKKPQTTVTDLPTPTDSAADSALPSGLPDAVSAEDQQATASSAPVPPPEDPAVHQPLSDSRDPPEPLSPEQAAVIQASKEMIAPTPSAPEASLVDTQQESAITPTLTAPLSSAVTDDAMDTSEDNPAPQPSHESPSVDLPHHPSTAPTNGDAIATPSEIVQTLVKETPAAVKTETMPTLTPVNVPEPTTLQDRELKDVPQSPGKMSRNREDDSGMEEPEAKRMRPTSAAGSGIAAASPANLASPSSPAPGSIGDRDYNSPMTEPQNKAIAVVMANTKRSTHAIAFSKPVDPVALNIPTYPDIVTEPMDLGTMNEKAKNKAYSNVQAFVSDFNLIVTNCEKFNGVAHAITNNAYKLRDTFEKQMHRVPSADYVEPPPPEKKKKIAAPRVPARRESRVAPQPKTPIAASPTQTFSLNPDGVPLIRRDSAMANDRPKREIHPPASKDLPYSARPKKKKFQTELLFCSQVLHELDKAKYAPVAGPFKHPVDPVALNIPNYHKVIKRPMDLSTMRRKLDSGQYESAKDFDSDMRLIFGNCYKFNQPGDFVYNCGRSLEGEYEVEWTKKDDWVRHHAPSSGPQSAGTSPEIDSDDADEEDEEEEEDHDEDQIAKLQSQIAAMSQQLQGLQKTKKKKSPPAAPKKKGGKKDSKKADKKEKKPKKAKGSTSVPYVSYEQKQDISNRINTLPEARMMQALEIIKNNMPNLKGADNDELELDIDELSNEVLYKLLQFVKKYAPKPDDEVEQHRPSYAPTQPAKPKKNKPMGAREQEHRIQELRRMQSGEGQLGAAAESSEDDEESDDESEEE